MPSSPGNGPAALRVAACVAALLLAPACKQDPTVGPAKGDFSLLDPSSGAIGVPTTPTFDWEDSFSVETPTYTIQVALDQGFSNLVVNQSGLTTTSFTPGTALADGTVYWWQVLAVRSTGTVVATGAPWQFTTFSATPGPFTLSAPTPLSTNVPVSPTFSWTASAGAASYTLQVTLPADTTFASPVVNQTGLTATSFTLGSPLTASTTYIWQVIAVSTASLTASNAPWTFMTGAAAPTNSVTLTSPSNMATGVSLTPTFTWTFGGTTPSSYVLQISTSSTFSSFVVNQGSIATTSYTVPSTAPLTSSPTNPYFWRVESLDSNNVVLATSPAFSFTTN